MKHTSLGELAIELGVNKSKLAYFYSQGLIKPVSRVGRMNIFDADETKKTLKKIDKLKYEKKTLKMIKGLLK
jgi:DNA-binding transcriptional MerR regulator